MIEENGSHYVCVDHIKKNGEERRARFNPKHFLETLGTGTPCKDPNIFRYCEINKEGETVWRSFDCRRVFRLALLNRVIEFKDVKA